MSRTILLQFPNSCARLTDVIHESFDEPCLKPVLNLRRGVPTALQDGHDLRVPMMLHAYRQQTRYPSQSRLSDRLGTSNSTPGRDKSSWLQSSSSEVRALGAAALCAGRLLVDSGSGMYLSDSIDCCWLLLVFRDLIHVCPPCHQCHQCSRAYGGRPCRGWSWCRRPSTVDGVSARTNATCVSNRKMILTRMTLLPLSPRPTTDGL